MLLDLKAMLNEEQLWLTEYLHKRVFCTYYEAMRAVIPSGLTMKVKVMCRWETAGNAARTFRCTAEDPGTFKRTEKAGVHRAAAYGFRLNKKRAGSEGIVQNRRGCFFGGCREKTADSKIVMVRLSDGYADLLQSGKIRMTQVRKKVISLLEESPSASLKRGLLLRRHHPSDAG